MATYNSESNKNAIISFRHTPVVLYIFRSEIQIGNFNFKLSFSFNIPVQTYGFITVNLVQHIF